jgi:hypothetical protein
MTTQEQLQTKRLGIFKSGTYFSFLGITYALGNFHYTGVLFGYSKMIFEQIKTRYLYFNEWNYSMEWTNWEYNYQLMKYA